MIKGEGNHSNQKIGQKYKKLVNYIMSSFLFTKSASQLD